MRYWRLAPALVALAAAGVFAYAPGVADGRAGAVVAGWIPRLFLIALVLTSFGFVGVEAALAWRRLRTAGRWGGWGVEAAWSIVPAVILASLVLHQSGVWKTAAPRVGAAIDDPNEETIRNWPNQQSPNQPAIQSPGREPQP